MEFNKEQIEKELAKYGLTPETYEKCLNDINRKMNKLTEDDWQDILDRYNVNIHYDTLRKASQTIFGGNFVNEYMRLKYAEGKESKTELSKARELVGEQYLLRRQIQNEKRELNKVKNDFVKSISVAEEIIEAIRSEGMSFNIPESCKTPIISTSNKSMVLVISDWHIGYKIINCKGNSFNYDIACERTDQLLEACQKYISLYNIDKVYVFNLGDSIENSYMRKTQNDNNEFKFNTQVAKVLELIFKLLTKLSESCEVIYDSVAGNHDRIAGDKTQNYDGDNINGIITPVLKNYVALSGNKRISIIERNCADKEIVTTINGVRFKLVHGDQNLKVDSLKNEISMDSCFYDVYVSGHWHNFKCVAENHGRYIIYNGCLSGFNDYSTAFGCASDAEQTIIVVGQNEIEMVKDVNLS